MSGSESLTARLWPAAADQTAVAPHDRMATPRWIPVDQLRRRDLTGPEDVSVDSSRSVVGDQTLGNVHRRQPASFIAGQ